MSMTDPVADMLTRIRNANTARHEKVDVPLSKLKLAIAQVLRDEGYVKHFQVVEEGGHEVLRVFLKYAPDRQTVISGIRRVSKPGRRVYVGRDRIPPVLNGLGIAILSTPKGVMSDKGARQANVGGELLCTVW
ncbi:MAG: 30S ribosomal protein S8 [Deltaproteobacteria bacterium]|nr:30S ribosomal protein S8 [Deltaproteobacteria bacterium]MBI3079439.1 30S ribosomal protein S8 [Deltaproteobacteria bacterium]